MTKITWPLVALVLGAISIFTFKDQLGRSIDKLEYFEWSKSGGLKVSIADAIQESAVGGDSLSASQVAEIRKEIDTITFSTLGMSPIALGILMEARECSTHSLSNLEDNGDLAFVSELVQQGFVDAYESFNANAREGFDPRGLKIIPTDKGENFLTIGLGIPVEDCRPSSDSWRWMGG